MAENTARKVGKFFDVRARQFDRIYRETSAPKRVLNSVLRPGIFERSKVLLREVERLEKPTLLDVGSGSGVNALAALEAGASFAVGVDVAPQMVDLSRERAVEAGLIDRCRFEQADFMEWPNDERYDIVTALGVFDYVADWREFFRKMAAKSLSSVVASFPGTGYRGRIRKVRYQLRDCPLFLYDLPQVTAFAREAGLPEIEVPFKDSTGFVVVARR
jgi:2-polyprenyl-3-methyl-5-hydroxy-6-metoxy-1,4-benzoquinol methylase